MVRLRTNPSQKPIKFQPNRGRRVPDPPGQSRRREHSASARTHGVFHQPAARRAPARRKDSAQPGLLSARGVGWHGRDAARSARRHRRLHRRRLGSLYVRDRGHRDRRRDRNRPAQGAHGRPGQPELLVQGHAARVQEQVARLRHHTPRRPTLQGREQPDRGRRPVTPARIPRTPRSPGALPQLLPLPFHRPQPRCLRRTRHRGDGARHDQRRRQSLLGSRRTEVHPPT